MSLEVFLMGLLIVSVMTSLMTEAIKIYLQEAGKAYHANALAGYVAVALSLALGIGYAILNEVSMDSKMAVCLITLVFLSWLSAMVGYDKVVQAIAQFKSSASD